MCTTTVNTTTTVTVTSGGSTTVTITPGASSTTQTKGEFCAANPGNAACGSGTGKESSFGGSCTAGFACEGDAALCAVSKATNLVRCALDGGTTEAQTYKDAQTAGFSLGTTSSTVAISAASFDSTNAFGTGGGAGFEDLQVAFLGSTVTIPLSMFNAKLEMLGNVLMAIAFLIAISIVGRGR